MGRLIHLSGVYRISLFDGRCYIGSSNYIQKRWEDHRLQLRKRVHHSRYLQFAYNKYGADAFTYEIVELCDPDLLTEREQWWIDTDCSAFNMFPTARSPLGFRHSAETKALWSAQRKGKNLGNKFSLGKYPSAETRAILSAQRKGRRSPTASLSNEQVKELRQLRSEGHLQRDLCARFGLSQPAISSILARKTYADVD